MNLLISLIILLLNVTLFAQDDQNIKIKVLKTGEYDYDAVCDFISARFNDAQTELVDAPKGTMRFVGNVMSPATQKSVKRYRYTNKTTTINFYRTNQKRIIDTARWDYSLKERRTSKLALLSRLGIKETGVNSVEIGCDAEYAQLFFDHDELETILIGASMME